MYYPSTQTRTASRIYMLRSWTQRIADIKPSYAVWCGAGGGEHRGVRRFIRHSTLYSTKRTTIRTMRLFWWWWWWWWRTGCERWQKYVFIRINQRKRAYKKHTHMQTHIWTDRHEPAQSSPGQTRQGGIADGAGEVVLCACGLYYTQRKTSNISSHSPKSILLYRFVHCRRDDGCRTAEANEIYVGRYKWNEIAILIWISQHLHIGSNNTSNFLNGPAAGYNQHIYHKT